MDIQAKASRDFTHDGAAIQKGDIVPLPTNQFKDWEGVELVKEATDKEIAAAKGSKA